MEQKGNQIRMRVMNMPERISYMYIHIEMQRKKKQTRQGRKKYTQIKKITVDVSERRTPARYSQTLTTCMHIVIYCVSLVCFFKSKLNRVYSTLSCIPFNIVFKLHRRQRFFFV